MPGMDSVSCRLRVLPWLDVVCDELQPSQRAGGRYNGTTPQLMRRVHDSTLGHPRPATATVETRAPHHRLHCPLAPMPAVT
jgi:hypothetical protein